MKPPPARQPTALEFTTAILNAVVVVLLFLLALHLG